MFFTVYILSKETRIDRETIFYLIEKTRMYRFLLSVLGLHFFFVEGINGLVDF